MDFRTNTGMSSAGMPMDEAFFEQMEAAGVKFLELSPGDDSAQDVDLEAIRASADRHGVTLWSYHLPFAPFTKINPASFDEGIREYTVNRFIALMQRGKAAGIGLYVMHLSGEPIAEKDRPQSLVYAKESVRRIAKAAGELGVTLAIEDLPRTCLGNCSADILDVLSVDDSVRVCFDTNHILKQSGAEFIREVGSKIVTLHVSDYDFVNERHWLPGEGDLPWMEIIAALDEVGYSGPWLYEMGFATPKTIVRPRNLCVQDLADNAKTLFEGKIPKGIGVRKPNLGMWE